MPSQTTSEDAEHVRTMVDIDDALLRPYEYRRAMAGSLDDVVIRCISTDLRGSTKTPDIPKESGYSESFRDPDKLLTARLRVGSFQRLSTVIPLQSLVFQDCFYMYNDTVSKENHFRPVDPTPRSPPGKASRILCWTPKNEAFR
ncbi:MAG: hypothetical protein MMC33_005153 [Icmadophila ericetorum]|nr:hypothetical protein [Icmadophila ericetorum]